MRRIAVLGLEAAALLFLDQWTKVLAVRALSLPAGALPTDPERIRTRIEPIAGEWFRLRLAGNKGVAGSMLAGLPDTWRLPLLVLMTIVALAVLLTLYQRSQAPAERMALVVVVGGALGNLSDRVRLGYVVDFIQWELAGYTVPTFNVADVLVCLGVLALVPTLLWRPARVASPRSPA